MYEYDKLATYHFEERKKAEKEKNRELTKFHKEKETYYDNKAFDIMEKNNVDITELYREMISKETTRAIRAVRYFRYRRCAKATIEEKERWAIDLIKLAVGSAKNPVVSCSFGIDSMTTLYLVRKALIEMGRKPSDINVMWSDTLNEFPEVRMFSKKIVEEWNLRLTIMKPKKPLKKVIDEHGGADSSYFFVTKGNRAKGKPLSEKCCENLKHEPMRRAIKTHSWDLQINGVRADEANQRKIAMLRDGEYYYSKKEWKAYGLKPIAWFTDDDVWEYVKKENIPYAPMYDNNLIQGYPADMEEVKIHKDKLEELGIDTEKLFKQQLVNLTRYQANFAQKIGFKMFTPKVGCMMCPIPVKYGYMQFIRTYYPKVYNTMIHNLGYGRALLDMISDEVKEEIEFMLGIDLNEDNAHEFMKDILQAKPCVFDKFN